MYKIDINKPYFYQYGKEHLRERTKQRLIQIIDCRMEEVGYGEFGYFGVISGLYIEKVWSYSDEEFNDLIEWCKDLIYKDENSKYGNN